MQDNTLKTAVTDSCRGLNVDSAILEEALNARVNSEMDRDAAYEELTNAASALASEQEPDWIYTAGRLHLMRYKENAKQKRGYEYEDYPRFVSEMVKAGRYTNRLMDYSPQELSEASQWIDESLDRDYDYAGAVLLAQRYLLENEMPQEAFLSCALLLAVNEQDQLGWAKRFYDALSQRRLSLATPILANLRVPEGSLSSCFIIAMDDNLESIYRELTNSARISKNGGGIGVNVSRLRATGSWVMGRANTSGGVVPWIKLLNDTALAVNQGGKRAGAVTVSIDTWHYDLPDFLDLQTEHGDQRRKAYDIFPQLVASDEFMERVRAGQDWTLVDPYEIRKIMGIELADYYGRAFRAAYQKIEAACRDGRLKLWRTVNARDIFKQTMSAQIETGLPYIAFKDTINRDNPNKHDGVIPGVNLCVAPETKVLTDKGYFPIGDLENQRVNVWNGETFSETVVRKTGSNQPLTRVHFSNWESLDCTYYHKFWVKNDYRQPAKEVEARDLQAGDRLIKYDLPVVEDGDAVDFPYAYTSGFFTGDGSHDPKGLPELALYGEKKDLLDNLEVRNNLFGNASASYERDTLAVLEEPDSDKLVCKLSKDLPPKFTVPLNGYTLNSRLDWLAGLLDSDGTVHRNGLNEAFCVTSIHLPFLKELRLMLQTLGVDSKIGTLYQSGYRSLPDGQENYKDYWCQQTYRLTINSTGVYQLFQLGLRTNRLSWTPRPPQRSASQFIKVVSIEETYRVDDTYCFHEVSRNLGMFNGILTGQCVESFSNVKPGELGHVCNLASLNLANLDWDMLPKACETAVRLLDNTIELTCPPFPDSAAHNRRYRTIGVGAMGLADWLAKNGRTYKDHDVINSLFEEMAYHCTNTSKELAKERGAYLAFEGSEWHKGKLLGAQPVETIQAKSKDPDRWYCLSEEVKKHGIRNSHITAIAPNTSSSMVQGCTASILPTYGKFFVEKWGKGALPMAPPYLNDCFWSYKENRHTYQQEIVDAIAEIQQWIDTGISMELLFNLNEGIYFDDGRAITAKEIFEILVSAWEKGCKTIYYIRSVQKDSYGNNNCSACAN